MKNRHSKHKLVTFHSSVSQSVSQSVNQPMSSTWHLDEGCQSRTSASASAAASAAASASLGERALSLMGSRDIRLCPVSYFQEPLVEPFQPSLACFPPPSKFPRTVYPLSLLSIPLNRWTAEDPGTPLDTGLSYAPTGSAGSLPLGYNPTPLAGLTR